MTVDGRAKRSANEGRRQQERSQHHSQLLSGKEEGCAVPELSVLLHFERREIKKGSCPVHLKEEATVQRTCHGRGSGKGQHDSLPLTDRRDHSPMRRTLELSNRPR